MNERAPPSYKGIILKNEYYDIDYVADFMKQKQTVVEYDELSEMREAHHEIPQDLREKPVLFDKYRDALYNMGGAVDLSGLKDEYSVHQSHEYHVYSGNKMIKSPFKPTPCNIRMRWIIGVVIPSSSTDFDVTIITQTSYGIFVSFNHLGMNDCFIFLTCSVDGMGRLMCIFQIS